MRVLVAVASKHGSTREIADRIGEVLRRQGLDATVSPAESVAGADGYAAVILGSAVYAGRWMKEARELADRVGSSEVTPPVWLFSSGPVGEPPKPEEDPVDVAPIAEALSARDHRVFAGKLDRSLLGFGERAIVTALRAPEGDFRDWAEISEWARAIAASLPSLR